MYGPTESDIRWGIAMLVGAGLILGWAMTFTINAFSDETSPYARGYCRALDAAVVADSLCVKGDSIVARVREEGE
jgi:hypothetical protein